MTDRDRRGFLRTLSAVAAAAGATAAVPAAIARALAIPASRRTGTIRDVEHIVILTQENRSFDHYFGTLNGVRGFADRFPVPVADSAGIVGKNVWLQPNPGAAGAPAAITPFRLDTSRQFAAMRVEGTPHSWADAQRTWDQGRMNAWPQATHEHAMGYYTKDDIPFQWALANAFTVCDAYHCAAQAGTNTNRLFLWTGTNDPLANGNGPAISNDYESFDADHGDGGYAWTTYPERLEAAGVSWQVYENMDDNFADNPLAGFRRFHQAFHRRPGHSRALRERGVSTRDLDLLKADALGGRLPSVSWIVATAEGSEHPAPSSPAQGADYTAKVLDALTANPQVWARTVLIVNFDENDGFFDHAPPPAPPSYLRWHADRAKALPAGASTVDTTGEYHELLPAYLADAAQRALLHRPYGLGPRVPMYLVSPWSRGGWVDSQVFDHTSVIRFIEARFGVPEPNISAWRRAVCGDLTGAFNFADPDEAVFFDQLPATLALAAKARALPGRSVPATPTVPALPVQDAGVRPSRALPYDLQVDCKLVPSGRRDDAMPDVRLDLRNHGLQGAVFHVYDRNRLTELPRRYTVERSKQLRDRWAPTASGDYDLWVLGPNGFHRHVTGKVERAGLVPQRLPEVRASSDRASGELVLVLLNDGDSTRTFVLGANAYDTGAAQHTVAAGGRQVMRLPLRKSGYWYDISVGVQGLPGFSRRFAGRLETGRPSISDPLMAGPALADQWRGD